MCTHGSGTENYFNKLMIYMYEHPWIESVIPYNNYNNYSKCSTGNVYFSLLHQVVRFI